MANQVGPDTVGGTAPQPGQVGGHGQAAGTQQMQGSQTQEAAGAQPTPGEVASAVPGTLPDAGQTHAAFHGRPVSWVSVSVIVVGFILGGVALVFGPTWPAFWAGVGLAVLGGLLALTTDIFEDWY